MITSKQYSLLDANILVYASNGNSPFHSTRKNLRDRGFKGELDLCVTPQVLFEFFAVITTSKRVESPITPKQALDEIEKYLKAKNIIKIYPKESTCQKVIDLSRKYETKSQKIFDIQIVAAMLSNNVKKIYSYDSNHFSKFEEIEVLQP